MPTASRPLIVRLRNWVGDVVLGLPMLQRLRAAGYEPVLVGKRWARELFEGEGFAVQVQPGDLRARVRQLRELARAARQRDAGFDARINALALPYSFSSALEMRLAGLRAIGHAHEGRSLLLARALPHPRQSDATRSMHELAIYWQIGSALLGSDAVLPPHIRLSPSPAQQARARQLLDDRGIVQAPVLICPFAGGTFAGQDKTWPEFVAFARDDLPALQRPVVVCPGPGEEPVAERYFPSAIRIDGVDLGTYAALLQHAALMIANDTGPGHLAAAVGAPLISVLGPTDPAQWRAWGPTVRLARSPSGWPTRAEVLALARSGLR